MSKHRESQFEPEQKQESRIVPDEIKLRKDRKTQIKPDNVFSSKDMDKLDFLKKEVREKYIPFGQMEKIKIIEERDIKKQKEERLNESLAFKNYEFLKVLVKLCEKLSKDEDDSKAEKVAQKLKNVYLPKAFKSIEKGKFINALACKISKSLLETSPEDLKKAEEQYNDLENKYKNQ